MMQEQVQKGIPTLTEENNKMINFAEEKYKMIDFEKVRKWVASHIDPKNPNHLLYSKGRNVIINVFDKNLGNSKEKMITIPSQKDNIENWKAAWREVFTDCADTLKAEFEFCQQSDCIRRSGENQYNVGNVTFLLPNDPYSIEYISTLEDMINTYDKLLREQQAQNTQKEENVISVNQSTVSIVKPSALIGGIDNKNVVEAQRVPLPKIEPDVTSASEAIVTASLSNMVKPTNEEKIEGEKLTDGEVVTLQEAREFKEANVPFVLVTCADITKGKERDIFIDNSELLAELNISLGAFLGGKALTDEQGDHELKVILTKLLNQHSFVGPIVYEVNNEAIISNAENSEAVMEIMNTSDYICSVIETEGYMPMKCMDIECAKIVEQAKQHYVDYQDKYYCMYRGVPRQIDELKAKEFSVLMDPSRDSDKVICPVFTAENKKTLPKVA